MKTLSEKEKKLDVALNKLINVNLNTNLKENLQHLNNQKNQLEIEKKEIENKYENLMPVSYTHLTLPTICSV